MSDATFRFGAGSRIGILLLTGFMVVVFLGCAVLALTLALDGETSFALIMLLLAAALGFLTDLMVREVSHRLNWRVTITGDQLILDLPRTRSYLARPTAFAGLLKRDQVQAVLWREERYDTAGLSIVIRAWALQLHDGRIILLGEDRPGTGPAPMYSHLVGDAGTAIAEWLGKNIRRRANVIGDGGILGVWKTRAPDW